jgi:hypothetical protein
LQSCFGNFTPARRTATKIQAISAACVYHPRTSQPPHRTIAIVELHLSLTQSIRPFSSESRFSHG